MKISNYFYFNTRQGKPDRLYVKHKVLHTFLIRFM